MRRPEEEIHNLTGIIYPMNLVNQVWMLGLVRVLLFYKEYCA